jgi:hypothetical protein
MRLAARLVAAVVLTAATIALPVAPAQAAACPSADGVTVVVDFHELGGGVAQVCDAGAGQYSAARFADAGFTLTRVQQEPGFVCRVEGKPASDPCQNTPPADAYWGLWWSDGKSGTWSYATQGVDSLKVPEGGYVALSWNGSSTKSPPGATPAAHADSSPSPSPSPSTKPTKSPSPQPASGQPAPKGGDTNGSASPSGPSSSAGGSTSGSAGPSVSPSAGQREPDREKAKRAKQDKPDSKHGRRPAGNRSTPPSPTTGESPSSAAAPTSEPPAPGDGMPVWIAPAAIGLLFAAAAGTAVVRRRRGSTGT